MIFVTVGTHNRGFNRLVQAADELSELLDEEVIIQRGSCTMVPRHATYFDWATSLEMEDWIDQSRLVIAHAGAGTIMLVLQHAKLLVLAPRRASYGEVFNDHQLQLAAAMERAGYATVASDLTGRSLLEAMQKATQETQPPVKSSRLVEAIRHQLSTWQEQPGSPDPEE